MSSVAVRAASEPDQQAVIDVMTLAFSTDPMARWAYPDPQTYLAIWPEMIKAFGSGGFAHRTVHLVEGGGAAAMWLPPGVQPDSERLEFLTQQHSPRERRADSGSRSSDASRPARRPPSSRCCGVRRNATWVIASPPSRGWQETRPPCHGPPI